VVRSGFPESGSASRGARYRASRRASATASAGHIRSGRPIQLGSAAGSVPDSGRVPIRAVPI